MDDAVTNYSYNAQGIRTAKWVDNLRTAFLLDGGNVVAEVQSNAITESYLRGINLIRRETSDTTEYYLFNAHGDVVNLIHPNGNISQSYDYDAFGVEKDPDPLDTNHFRYCGEYLDGETGSYYLRARYYTPEIGRFTQQDTHWNTSNMIYGDNPQKINEREDKLGLKSYSYAPQVRAILQAGNLYVYSVNNPVVFIDRNGRAVETVFDVVSLVISIIDVAANPSSTWAWLGLAGDILDLIPFVTGVGETVKAFRVTCEVTGKTSDIIDMAGNLIGSYKDLRKLTKGTDLEVHHLIEKRFAKTLGLKENTILSMVLDKSSHSEITQKFRNIIGYANDSKDAVTLTANADKIWDAIVKVYKAAGLEGLIPLLKEFLLENAENVDEITDWKGY